jgi:hypothetical protein
LTLIRKLAAEDRARILHLLCEGNSIRAVKRVTGASKNTVVKLLVAAGKACHAYHDEHVLNVRVRRIQVDEIWSFTYAKQNNVAKAKSAPAEAGDTWTWTAIEADTKLVVSWLVERWPPRLFGSRGRRARWRRRLSEAREDLRRIPREHEGLS